MHHSSPTQLTASGLPSAKITRKQVAAHYGLCVRIIDNLTRSGVLGHYRIGKSVRYDLAEVEATLRARFHVGGAAQGGAGWGQPAATKRPGTGEKQRLQENLRPAIHESRTDAAAAHEGKVCQGEDGETHDGGLRTSRPTTLSRPASRRSGSSRAPAHSITHSTTQA